MTTKTQTLQNHHIPVTDEWYQFTLLPFPSSSSSSPSAGSSSFFDAVGYLFQIPPTYVPTENDMEIDTPSSTSSASTSASTTSTAPATSTLSSASTSSQSTTPTPAAASAANRPARTRGVPMNSRLFEAAAAASTAAAEAARIKEQKQKEKLVRKTPPVSPAINATSSPAATAVSTVLPTTKSTSSPAATATTRSPASSTAASSSSMPPLTLSPSLPLTPALAVRFHLISHLRHSPSPHDPHLISKLQSSSYPGSSSDLIPLADIYQCEIYLITVTNNRASEEITTRKIGVGKGYLQRCFIVYEANIQQYSIITATRHAPNTSSSTLPTHTPTLSIFAIQDGNAGMRAEATVRHTLFEKRQSQPAMPIVMPTTTTTTSTSSTSKSKSKSKAPTGCQICGGTDHTVMRCPERQADLSSACQHCSSRQHTTAQHRCPLCGGLGHRQTSPDCPLGSVYMAQHIEMPDLDSMTYEQILEWQSKIGRTAIGLRQQQISSLLSFPFSTTDDRIPSDERECKICLGEYRDGEMLRRMIRGQVDQDGLCDELCGHTFHRECIDRWLREAPTCPVCRQRLKS